MSNYSYMLRAIVCNEITNERFLAYAEIQAPTMMHALKKYRQAGFEIPHAGYKPQDLELAYYTDTTPSCVIKGHKIFKVRKE